ncbi:HD domain-containing protein, partial [Escherichia coli]|nr:HD domain-containing protein [Escherichia coli]
WNAEDRLLCLCAALLHDVGHGPFSHSFEKVFSLDHEKWAVADQIGMLKIDCYVYVRHYFMMSATAHFLT